MNDLLFTPIRLNELEVLIENSVKRAMLQNSPELNDPQPTIETPVTIDEVVKITGLTKPTLYGYAQRSEIPYHKKGNRLYFFKSEIIEWIKAGRQKTVKQLQAEVDVYLSNNKKGLK